MITAIHGVIASSKVIIPETWDISTAFYLKEFHQVDEAVAPDAGTFSADGTKMYVMDSISTVSTIYQYTLSSAWDINTASYDTVSYVATEVADATGITISGDGTKMYVMDFTTDTIYQYTLSTPWSLTGASYSTFSKSVNAEDTQPRHVAFKANGTKMYVVGWATDRVHQYTLSTAWRVSTATSDSVNVLVSGQDGFMQSIDFKSDGTKMYLLGGQTKNIYPYTLSSAWDMSTATYDTGVSFSLSTITPTAIKLNSDGTQVYAVDQQNERVYGYTMTAAYDVSTASFPAKSMSPTPEDTNPRSVTFNPDGTIMYVGGYTAGILQYTLSSPYEVNTATYATKAATISGEVSQLADHRISADGSKMYVLDTSDDTIYQYTVGTPWDMSTVSYASKSTNVTSEDAAATGIYFNNSGSRMFMVGQINDTVYQYNLGTAWDVSTVSYASLSKDVTAQTPSAGAVIFSPTGSLMFILDQQFDTVWQYTLSSPFNVSTATYASLNKVLDISGFNPVPYSANISPDGTSLYIVVTETPDVVYQYTLT